MHTHRTVFALLVAASLAMPAMAGCLVTQKTFDALAVRVNQLERDRTAMTDQQARDRTQLSSVRQELAAATDALRKGGANLGADVDGLKADVAKLKGADEEQSYSLSKQRDDVDAIKKVLDEKLGVAVVQLPKGLPEDRESLYKAGKAAFDKGDFPMARGVMRKFLDTYPDEPRAPEAMLMIGETFFKEAKYGQAMVEFQRVFSKYQSDPKSPVVPRALLRIAEALLKQDDCKKATAVLKLLVETYRKAPEADRARDLLKDLKGRKKCG